MWLNKPVGVVLADNVQHISLFKVKAGLFTGNVGVVGGVVVKVGAHAHLALPVVALEVGRHQFEGYCPLRVLLPDTISTFKIADLGSNQDLEDVVGRLALGDNVVDLDDLVADVDEPRAVGGTTVHYSGDHDLPCFLIRFYRGALFKSTINWFHPNYEETPKAMQ
jgi:hypothetical protein